jgi:hypothetical protein
VLAAFADGTLSDIAAAVSDTSAASLLRNFIPPLSGQVKRAIGVRPLLPREKNARRSPACRYWRAHSCVVCVHCRVVLAELPSTHHRTTNRQPAGGFCPLPAGRSPFGPCHPSAFGMALQSAGCYHDQYGYFYLWEG